MTLNLNYEGFEKNFIWSRRKFEGIRYRFQFDNKFGASVIKHSFSYGNEDDLWELAVLKERDDGTWVLCDDTDISADVIGCLTDDEVREYLKQISELNEDGTLNDEKES